MLQKRIVKLRHMPEASMDAQLSQIYKHRILAEIGRRHERTMDSALSMREQVRFFALRTARRVIPTYQKSVMAAVLILVMVGTSVMAQAAVPGDPLWPVKITIEKAEVALALDPAQESRVHLKHVDNRLKELRVIVGKQDTAERSGNISQLVRRLEKDMVAAGQSLKITKDEKRDTQPQVVMALAKDLNDKAVEAVKALEENKVALAGESVVPVESALIPTFTTTTEPVLLVDGETATTAPSAVVTPESQAVEKKREMAQVIAEVQIVNEYISYNALSAFIEVVERQGGVSRGEVTALLKQKISEQETRLAAVTEAIPLVSDDFLLHRSEARLSATKAKDLLGEANDFVNLDNLSASLKNLISAKDAVEHAARVLREVSDAGGLKKTEETKASQEVIENVQTGAVTIQSIAQDGIGEGMGAVSGGAAEESSAEKR